jgi:putative ABC transport system permease protein
MFKNYIKIAFRKLWKERTFTALNVLGLTAAFTAAFLLSLFAVFELSYDQFHKDGDSIYQIYTDEQIPQGIESSISNPVPFAQAFKDEVPGVEKITRVMTGGPTVIINEQSFNINATWADADYLKMFTFPIIAGNSKNPLQNKSDVVLTERASKRFFADIDPIGQTLNLIQEGEQVSVTVTAIVKDLPKYSSLNFDAIFNFTVLPERIYASNIDRWDNHNHEVYIKLKNGIDAAQFEKSTATFSSQHFASDMDTAKRDGAQPNAAGNYRQIKLLPLSDLNFTSFSNNTIEVNKNLTFIVLAIAFLIVFISCVNFINMSVGKGTKRLKEIGMRKTLGASKRQLFLQFWGESIVVFLFSIIIAYCCALLLLPYFQELFRTQATFEILVNPTIISLAILGFFTITLLAGGYPAYIMSKLKTLQALKGKVENSGKNYIRNTLMVVQFCIAILMISGTLVIWNQLEFLRSKDLGFNKEQVIAIPLQSAKKPEQLMQLLRNKLSSEPSVLSISASRNILGLGKDGSRSSSAMGFEHEGREIKTNILNVDYDYPETLDIPIIAGRTHQRSYAADSLSVVINESMAAQFNVENPVGLMLDLDFAQFKVIGVIKDFNFQDLNNSVQPLSLFMSGDTSMKYAYVKVSSNDLEASFDKVKAVWESIEKDQEFLGSYLDENIDRTLRKERNMTTMITSGSILAIILSCIGLFAISLLVVAQRRKEIGIRKVVGATVSNITLLLTKDFIKLVFIAFVIAAPIAYLFSLQWLENYTYRIDLSMWLFVQAGILALMIAIATISIKTIAAAISNPVNSIKTE